MLQLVERGFFKSTPIKLSISGGPEGVSPEVQVLRVGNFNHPKYGEFAITALTLQELKTNFDAKVRGVDIAIDYFHKSDESAAGWVKELYLSEDGSELWARVDWTKEATKKLSDREIRYFSPDFAFKWTDPESGKEFDNVLFGGGLTNRPFVKDMAAIVAAEGEPMTVTELEKKVLKLAEDGADLASKHSDLMKKHEDLQKAHSDLQKKMAEMDDAEGDDDSDDSDDSSPNDMKKQLADMKAKCAEYEESAKKANEAKVMAEKETAFNLLLTEGKACAAQKDAFISGDMTNFIKLAQPVNLNGKGTIVGVSDTGDRDERILKLAEEKCKADPKLSKIDAMTLANREIKA